ncbi:hypothetical protein BDR03DRAFT_968480 [Suillus americanus]|nr:hypothetical protein BDR03DRAFT_968480 [Suillus americanus]
MRNRGFTRPWINSLFCFASRRCLLFAYSWFEQIPARPTNKPDSIPNCPHRRYRSRPRVVTYCAGRRWRVH